MKNIQKLSFTIFSLAAILCLSMQPAICQTRIIKWGISGHPLSQEAYLHQQPHFKNSLVDQLNILKDIGLTWYRFDVPTDIDGNVLNKADYKTLKAEAAKRGIKLLPLLFLVGLDYGKQPQEMYNVAYKCGRNFALQNAFDYLEAGNEQDSPLLLANGQVPGNITAHYDIAKTKIVAAYLKGLINGVKSVRANAKIIVNAGWVHYGFFELLNKEGVKYDIIGYHWYSDMGHLNRVREYNFNIMDFLYQKFKKPIWITEINQRNGDSGNSAKQQASWVASNIKQVKANKYVQAMFLYELYDEPVFAPSTESNYGIIGWKVKYEQPFYKPVANTIKALIKSK